MKELNNVEEDQKTIMYLHPKFYLQAAWEIK